MKSVIMTIVAMASISASASTYVTVEVCGNGEVATCEKVTYKVRKGKMVQLAQQPQGASSEGIVQTPREYGIPSFLQKLSDALGGAAGTADPADLSNGGPN
ncbi:MAG: hypothetical protein H7061_09355 [Bdellovibrionaceae bacterium]|nr:hypothetical protein [Bdellovibrio sp.]